MAYSEGKPVRVEDKGLSLDAGNDWNYDFSGRAPLNDAKPTSGDGNQGGEKNNGNHRLIDWSGQVDHNYRRSESQVLMPVFWEYGTPQIEEVFSKLKKHFPYWSWLKI